jgi:hypothetical protein
MIRESERGATAMFVAGALILLIGMAAVAIDVGAGFNERRQNQTAADVGVLAGVLDYLNLGLCGAPVGDAEDGGCNELLGFARTNLTATFSEPEWIAAWQSCQDPDKPSGFGPLPVDTAAWGAGFQGTRWDGTVVLNAVDCISVSPQELRVKVPDQLLDTTFGRILGVEELRTLAVAQAALLQPSVGGVLPFGVLSNAGGHVCLLTAPAGTAEPPCDGSDSGNFFTLESQTWGAPSSDQTSIDCGNPGAAELTINVALGLDHLIAIADEFVVTDPATYSFDNAPSGTADDLTTREDECTLSGGVAVPADVIPDTGPRDTMQAGTGTDDRAPVIKGLINGLPADFAANAPNGGAGVTPRLQRMADCTLPDGTSCASDTRQLRERVGGTNYSHDVNDVPLWDYLEPAALSIDCDSDGTPDLTDTNQVDTTDEMTCLLENLPVGPIFSDAIESNSRFARVPQFHFEEWGPGTHWQPVKAYRMVYLHSIWFVDGANPFEFQPGESSAPVCLGTSASCATLRILQVEAFLLPDSAVPASVANNFPGGSTSDLEAILTR